MNKTMQRGLCCLAVVGACAAPGAVLAGCAPEANAAAGSTTAVYATDDDAYEGDYDVYDPDVESEDSSGSAIEGSEEEQLQQERIAGGSVGDVTSTDLEDFPEDSITESGDEDYVATLGIYGQPPSSHGLTASCTGCHDPEKIDAEAAEENGTKVLLMPLNHQGIGLTDDDCVSCHTEED